MSSTQIQFPRFQTETSPDAPVYKRELCWRSPQNSWLSKVLLDTLLRPLEASPTEHINVLKEQKKLQVAKWWGEHHSASVLTLPEVTLANVDIAQEERLRTRVFRHYYDWDSQSMPGRATEVVVDAFNPLLDRYDERAALLAHSDTTQQRLVLRPGHGEWRQPAPQEMGEAEHYLFAMTLAANSRA